MNKTIRRAETVVVDIYIYFERQFKHENDVKFSG